MIQPIDVTANSHADADMLFVGGGFFGYAMEITRALEQRGRKVAWFEDRPALDTFTKSAIRLAPSLVTAKSDAYFASILRQLRGDKIRDVLVIKGEALSVNAIDQFRAAMPNARFTLYFWDSYRNMPGPNAAKVAQFDRAYTFDPEDARADPRLSYRPLFYLPEYARASSVTKDIDLLFVGTAHSDRYSVIRRLSQSLPASVVFEKRLYVPSKLIYHARRITDPTFWRAKRAEFTFQSLSKEEISMLIARSRAILDIERTSQCGLTMRTIEAFGAGRKIVTTNSEVMRTDIYNSSNIAVIDRRNPRVDPHFLTGCYAAPAPRLVERYSLAGWLNEVIPD